MITFSSMSLINSSRYPATSLSWTEFRGSACTRSPRPLIRRAIATPGAALADEGGRGVCLRRFLLPPLPLLSPHLVSLGGGPACTCSLNSGSLILGQPVRDPVGQLLPDCAMHVLLRPELRHGGHKHQLVAGAAVPRHPTLVAPQREESAAGRLVRSRRPGCSSLHQPAGGKVPPARRRVLHLVPPLSPALAIFGRCALWCDIVARAAATLCCSCRHHERKRRCLRRQAAPEAAC